MPPRRAVTRTGDPTSRRTGGQILDLDPTDGLPVQKYSLQTVAVNQDASSDPNLPSATSTNSKEWAAQFNTPSYPWSEQPLPSFHKELQPWNQELIRRARAGNTNAKLSVWDRQNGRWMSAAEAEKKATPLKSLHLNNLEISGDANGKAANGDSGDSPRSNDDSVDEASDQSDKSADEDEDDDADADAAPFKLSNMSSKRRKLVSRLNPDEPRTIEIRKWVQLPANIAERTPERSFLAPRRPGMPALYQPDYATKLFGQFHSSSTIGGATGYDLGEGGGLANAGAVVGAGPEMGTATPPRKNIPPRRKKKKLGGPGRKKAVRLEEQPSAQVAGGGTAVMTTSAEGVPVDSGAMEGVKTEAGDAAGTVKEDGEGAEGDDNDNDNDSGSEAEGSEEGEIDEGGNADIGQELAMPEAPAIEEAYATTKIAPEVTITDTDMIEAHASESATIATEQVTPVPEVQGPPAPLPVPATTSSIEVSIPGLGDVTDPEEKAIIEENAQAISSAEQPATEEAEGVSAAIGKAVAQGIEEGADVVAEKKIAAVEERAEEREVDLLGAMDEAIDRGMSEGRGAEA